MGGGGREPHIIVMNEPKHQWQTIYNPAGGRSLECERLQRRATGCFAIDKNRSGEERDVANTLTAREDRGVSEQKQTGTAVGIILKDRGGLPKMYDGYNGKMRKDQNACTLTSQCGYTGNRGGQQVVLPVLTPDRIEKRQNGRRFKENGDPAFTLTSEDRSGVEIGIEGNYMPSGHSAGNIISQGGVSPTVMENHGTVSAVTVRVKEATKQGYAVARGGAGQYQPLNAGIENKKRTSRGRYGEHFGLRM